MNEDTWSPSRIKNLLYTEFLEIPEVDWLLDIFMKCFILLDGLTAFNYKKSGFLRHF